MTSNQRAPTDWFGGLDSVNALMFAFRGLTRGEARGGPGGPHRESTPVAGAEITERYSQRVMDRRYSQFTAAGARWVYRAQGGCHAAKEE